jgi:hypothetical protein
MKITLTEEEYARQIEDNLKFAYEHVIENRDFKMNKAKIRHDRAVRPSKFKIGDLVWLSVEATKVGVAKKLSHRWNGPYKIINILNETNYCIKPTDRKGRKSVVHHSRLKRCFMRRADLEESESLDTTQTSISSTPIIDQNITPETSNYQILEEVERTKAANSTTITITPEQTINNIINLDDDTPLIDVQASIRTLGMHKTTERPQIVLRRSTRVKKPPDLQRH